MRLRNSLNLVYKYALFVQDLILHCENFAGIDVDDDVGFASIVRLYFNNVRPFTELCLDRYVGNSSVYAVKCNRGRF